MQKNCNGQLESACWIITYEQVLIFKNNTGNNYSLGQLGNFSCKHFKMLMTFSPPAQAVSEG